MITRWFANFRVSLVWLLSFVLALIILALGHEVLINFTARTLGWDRYDARFIHLLYYTLAGGIWILFFVLIFEYFKNLASKGRLLYATLRTLGVQLAVIVILQILLIVYGYFPADWLNLALVLITVGLATGMLFFARRIKNYDGNMPKLA